MFVVLTPSERRNTKKDETFPEVALLFQYDENAINQVIVDSILCRPVRDLRDAGGLRLRAVER